eukprot:TRINITY_DN294_c0_g1_i1.p1 TRINITY_DN294_c0_g1~~TRINITY_DN294_c0_g1_i1.p1  ORF type:complete len:175 (+),score=36.36 TRINITY_DN294_c0_g1_i1:158-682(+)
MSNLTPDEEEEVTLAFKICDSDGDGVLNPSEAQLYLYGLGCNLTKEQLNELGSAQLSESSARDMFLKFRPSSTPTAPEICNVFRTWDPAGTGEVDWDVIMAPVGDGKDVAPFEAAVIQTLNNILKYKGVDQTGPGKKFKYEKFADIMAQTMGMQAGKDKAPLMFESELLKINLD